MPPFWWHFCFGEKKQQILKAALKNTLILVKQN
jgi:hypothetical protein